MNPPINSTKAAALIEASTGRQCSRQNLEKLCANGGLQGSPCIVQAKPLRLNPDLLVSEYLAKVGPHQSEAVQPRMKRELPTRRDTTRPPRQLPQSSDDPPAQPDQGLPEYTISRARLEYEKANLAELERRAKAKLLLPREDVEQAWATAVNICRSRLLGVPSVAKQRIPHLDLNEVEMLTTLIRDALEELAAGEAKE
jgi:hypothetical protein